MTTIAFSFNTRARARRAPIPIKPDYRSNKFQHTCPREAGTCQFLLFVPFPFLFQHTCPREAGTRARGNGHCRMVCFNTRARARRARVEHRFDVRETMFQHTCPREAGTRM